MTTAEVAASSVDPILPGLGDYLSARQAIRSRHRAEYHAVLEEAAGLYRGVRPFCTVVQETIHRLEERSADGIDPYYSTSIAQWVGAVRRGLKWVESGADPAFLKYYADAEAFLTDVESEFPNTSRRRRAVPFVGFWVQPADTVAQSARLRERVTDCLPEFPGHSYAVLDDKAVHSVAGHFDRAVGALRCWDPTAYEAVVTGLTTAFVALHKDEKVSLGTRADCFGTLIAGLSPERLASDNVAATASQLYHEACHLKLALYLEVEQPALGADPVFVSPFKNETRDLETMLHTAYTLSIECLTRLALASEERDARWERSLAYLAAVAARLELVGEIAELGLGKDHPAPLRRIPILASEAVRAVRRKLASVSATSRALHEQERIAVRARHTWDIGQFLVRGVQVIDPGLQGTVRVTSETVAFRYDGRPVTASREAPKPSIGDYGRYIEAVL
ncbi:MAG: HEXXH motif-containing putative peptide modification protein [Actinomycetota bacterium]|nr:HEXXH motif-containing putative peptide modification protein [Actinomycetota bacterium]